MTTTNSNRPLVLLDVDGVINDLDGLIGVVRPWNATIVASHGFGILIPDYMTDLVRVEVSTDTEGHPGRG